MSTSEGDSTSQISDPSSRDAQRGALIDFIRTSKLGYGEWARFKQLYKQTESDPAAEVEVLGALIARIDGVDARRQYTAQAGMTFHAGASSALIQGDIAYVTTGNWRGPGSILAYALKDADPLHPARRGISPLPAEHHQLFRCGEHLAVGQQNYYGAKLRLLDVSDPAHIQLRGAIDIAATGLTASDGRFFALLEQNYRVATSKLHVVDISDQDHPSKAAVIDILDANMIAASRGLICVGVGRVRFGWGQMPKDAGLRLLDLSDPRQPRIVGSLALRGICALAMSGSLIFAGVTKEKDSDEASLEIIDASDAKRPRKLSSLKLAANPQAISVQNDLAFVAMDSGSTLLIDVSDPLAPKVIGRSKATLHAIQIRGDKAYAHSGGAHVIALDLKHRAHPQIIGQAVRAETVAYMKRRARRLLRNLAKREPDRYVLLAHKVLEAATGVDALDLRRNWIVLDILFGPSDRYRQTRHGRGAYVPNKAKLRLRTREERAPEAWNERPELAAGLFQNASLPWQTQEFAWKVLRDTGTPIPPINSDHCLQMLTSPSPLLARVALRRMAARIALGETTAPGAAVAAYLRAGVRLRREIETGLRAKLGDAEWRLSFARRMLTQIEDALNNGVMARRQLGGALLIATMYPETASSLGLLSVALAFLSARRAPLTEMIVTAARGATPRDIPNWVLALAGADEAQQEAVTQALELAVSGKSITPPSARQMVLHDSEAVRAAGWRVLAASMTGLAVLQPIWTDLLSGAEPTPALRTAMGSAAALSLLERAGFGPDAIAERLAARPFLVDLLSSSAFARMTQTLPPPVTLALIAAASDAQWETLRGGWLRNLQEGIGLSEFWHVAETAVANAEDDRLERRLLTDDEVARTFVASDDATFLNLRETAFGPVMERWARAHEALFPRDSGLLLQAATHILPEVRAWGLTRVEALGMEMPFALRLLESEVPASVAAGQTFFKSVTAGERQERNYALALCDSPKATVRAIGREFVLARRESLPMPEVLRALFEHDATDMQSFAAELLDGDAGDSTEAALFARTVLRARHRGRRAKETVKARQSASADAPTLLALARGRTARDSEWAFTEMAKRALAGETIDGFVLDGPAGG